MKNDDLIRNLLFVAAGAALGAAAMYWLDPALGAGRRGALRGGRRLRAMAGLQPATRDERDDARLRDRVRARLGALVSHPGAVEVSAENAVVRLSGHVLAKEQDGLLFQVRHIPGVHRVINALTAHDSAEGMLAAQAGGGLPRRRMQPA